jgi:hypothetical protein
MPELLDHISPSISILSPEEIDRIIIDEIEQATAENSSVWTCPDFNRREYAHSFFQYPAMMIPAVQRKLIEIITEAKPDTKNMLDCFLGSATTMIASMESGLNCYGQDINPLAVLIAKARTGPYYIDKLIQSSQQLLQRVKQDTCCKIEAKFSNREKWFKEKISYQLSKLVRAIRQEPLGTIRKFFWVVLAETVRLSSNDRTSTFKMHVRKQEEIDKRNFSAIDVFQLHIDRCIEDFQSHFYLLDSSGHLHSGRYTNTINIRLESSKDHIYTPTGEPFFDILVTSPPYGDNKTTVTYGQHSYLPLQWIDFNDIDKSATSDFLKTTSEIDTRSLGGKAKAIDETIVNTLFAGSPTFKATHEKIKSIAAKKVYKVESFWADLNATIDNIFKVMKQNSYQVWTIGNRNVAKVEIPNDDILAELIESKGGKLITKLQREIINKRMAKRNKDATLMNNEDILIFRKIGRT